MIAHIQTKLRGVGDAPSRQAVGPCGGGGPPGEGTRGAGAGKQSEGTPAARLRLGPLTWKESRTESSCGRPCTRQLGCRNKTPQAATSGQGDGRQVLEAEAGHGICRAGSLEAEGPVAPGPSQPLLVADNLGLRAWSRIAPISALILTRRLPACVSVSTRPLRMGTQGMLASS